VSVLSIGRSVRPLVTTVNSGKTTDSIKMPFGVAGQVGPRNHVLDGGPGPPKRGTFGEMVGAM